MAHPTEDLSTRVGIPTEPYDSTDPPRFGQLSETAKDAFKKELEKFFDYKSTDSEAKLTEIPNIEKFAIGEEEGEQSLETVVRMLMAYGDKPNQFPMIVITSTSGREKVLGIGSNFVSTVQYPPRVEGTTSGTISLTDGWTIEITTWPLGTEESATASTITFSSVLFSDISSVTISDIVRAINVQALYYTAEETSSGTLRLKTGGVCAQATPNYIEVTGGDAACLTALGFTIGQSDTYLNTQRPPMNRYYDANDMTINVDIVTDDINTRTELADLVRQFFTYYVEKRRFQFYGESYFEEGLDPEQWYHIILERKFAWSAELNTPRPGGEQYDYIYAKRGTVPFAIIDYINKRLETPPVFLHGDDVELGGVIVDGDPVESGLPTGDYGGINYLKLS
jgi:hypothetical protein